MQNPKPITAVEVVRWFAMKRNPVKEDHCDRIVKYLNDAMAERKPQSTSNKRINLFGEKEQRDLLVAVACVRKKADEEGTVIRAVFGRDHSEQHRMGTEQSRAGFAYGQLVNLLDWMRDQIETGRITSVSLPSPLWHEVRRLARLGHDALMRAGHKGRTVHHDSPLVRFVTAALKRMGHHMLDKHGVQKAIERGGPSLLQAPTARSRKQVVEK